MAVSTTSPPITAVSARAVQATKVYGDIQSETEVRALDGVDVTFERGVYSAIMGPSGSGKSTLLHCIAGLDTLTAGQVFLGDIELSALSDNQLTQLRRDRVGFVFQSYNLIPTLTALENITLPLALAGRSPDKEWLDHIIDIVGLRSRLAHRPSELSG
ncbi:MAG TPA: ATP-binding cassette domain-containing protein, partial [Acidimicrobiia bacterium]|nr:ATP-binding cassette domain-containing protein [Acidimicrobiia bacterium]